jgi:hypothetical protein
MKEAPIALALVAALVSTVTSAMALPLTHGGETAVISVEDTCLKDAACLEPNLTPVIATNSSPVIVTVVPPAVGPCAGETLFTRGATGDAPAGVADANDRQTANTTEAADRVKRPSPPAAAALLGLLGIIPGLNGFPLVGACDRESRSYPRLSV